MPDRISDEELLAEVAAATAEFDPAPATAIAAAKASLTWRTIDAELAELVQDSALEPLAGIRSVTAPRLLTFETHGSTVVVEITARGDRRRLLGQLAEPQSATVELRTAEGRFSAEADSFGRFTVEDVPAGPMSLSVTASDGTVVVTAWVTI